MLMPDKLSNKQARKSVARLQEMRREQETNSFRHIQSKPLLYRRFLGNNISFPININKEPIRMKEVNKEAIYSKEQRQNDETKIKQQFEINPKLLKFADGMNLIKNFVLSKKTYIQQQQSESFVNKEIPLRKTPQAVQQNAFSQDQNYADIEDKPGFLPKQYFSRLKQTFKLSQQEIDERQRIKELEFQAQQRRSACKSLIEKRQHLLSRDGIQERINFTKRVDSLIEVVKKKNLYQDQKSAYDFETFKMTLQNYESQGFVKINVNKNPQKKYKRMVVSVPQTPGSQMNLLSSNKQETEKINYLLGDNAIPILMLESNATDKLKRKTRRVSRMIIDDLENHIGNQPDSSTINYQPPSQNQPIVSPPLNKDNKKQKYSFYKELKKENRDYMFVNNQSNLNQELNGESLDILLS